MQGGEGMTALLPGIVCGGYTEVIWGLYGGYIGLHKDNGKENGKHYFQFMGRT